MTAPGPQHAAGGSSFARSAGAAAGRGILLILFAVVIGAVLLGQGFDDGDGAAPGATTQTDDSSQTDDSGADLGDVTDASTTDGSVTTTTAAAAAARPPAEVTVLVANGSRSNGVAASNSDELNRLGYTVGQPTNAIDLATSQNTQVEQSTVYFAEGFQADATAVAEALGIPATQVAAMPETPPVGDLAGANVLVIIGLDGLGVGAS
jgi:hypothetical protein